MAGFYVGATLRIISGTNAGQSRTVTVFGIGWVSWLEPMPSECDDTSVFTITEYYVMVQSVNKYGLICPCEDCPVESLVLGTLPVHLINTSTFEKLDTLKPMSPIQTMLTNGPSAGVIFDGLSMFVDLGSNNSGLFFAYVKNTSFADNIYLNNTLIYAGAWQSVGWLSLHSIRNDKACISFDESGNIKLIEVDCTTTPWTIGSAVTLLAAGTYYYDSPQLYNQWC